MSVRRVHFVAILLFAAGPALCRADDANWPQFLGPDRNNRSRETGLLASWPAEGPKLLKTVKGLGVGFSNVAIAGETLYTMGNHSEREYVLAFDLISGNVLWKFENAAAFKSQYGDGPRGTPTLDGDRLYALGAGADLVCLDRAKGTKVWQLNIIREFGSDVPKLGICESVLVDGDKVICTPGAPGGTLVALQKKTGKVVWKAGSPRNEHANFASPIIVEAGGVRQYVQFTEMGTIGIRAADGKFLWYDDSSANHLANCCTAVAADGMVFTTSAYGTGGSLLKLESQGGETTCRRGWHSLEMMVHHGGIVLFEGHLYATNDQVLLCAELETGAVKWKNRSVGKGSLTFADGKLYVRGEKGPVALIEATPVEYRELGRFNPPKASGKSAFTYPVVAGGRLYLRDQDSLFVHDVKGD